MAHLERTGDMTKFWIAERRALVKWLFVEEDNNWKILLQGYFNLDYSVIDPRLPCLSVAAKSLNCGAA